MPLLAQSFSENRRTLALAVPIIAGFVGQMLMGWADTIMVGKIGVIPLAACAFANTVLAVPLVFGFAVLSSVSVRASLAFGAGRERMSGEALRGGLLIALFLGILVGGGLHLVAPFLSVLGQGDEITNTSRNFLVICAWSAVPVFITTAAKNFCEALSRPWVPFWIMMAGVLLNIALNWVLIYGNLGSPAMGIDGAGVATATARIAVATAVVIYVLTAPSLQRALPVAWFRRGFGTEIRRLLGIGLPSGGMQLAEVSGFASGSLMMGWLGAGALAAHQIAITCAATTFMIPLGLSQAVAVRIGQARGAAEEARYLPIIFGAWGVTASIMAIFAALFMGAGTVIATWFVEDSACHSASCTIVADCGAVSDIRWDSGDLCGGSKRFRGHAHADADWCALLLGCCAPDLLPRRLQTRIWPTGNLVRFCRWIGRCLCSFVHTPDAVRQPHKFLSTCTELIHCSTTKVASCGCPFRRSQFPGSAV